MLCLADLEDDEKVEGAADILAPMQEKLVDNSGENVVVECVAELEAEEIVEAIEDSEHLLEQVGVLRVEDGLDCGEEVVVVEVVRELLVRMRERGEVALHEVEALDHAVCLEEVRFGEDEHHEGGQQLLVAHQLHVALPHLRAQLHHLAACHLAHEHRQQLAVTREILP